MFVIATMLKVGILWFLITLFTRSNDSKQSFNETLIVIFGMMLVGILSRIFLVPLIGYFTVLIEIAALYFLVDFACGHSRKVTLKICGWYLVIGILLSLFGAIMNMEMPSKS